MKRLLWRKVYMLLASVAGALCGCDGGSVISDGGWVTPAYGMPPVPLAVHSFSYVPSGPVHLGDTLTFLAEVEPAENPQAAVYVKQGDDLWLFASLNDEGQVPDTAAGDNIFTGTGVWSEFEPGLYQVFVAANAEKDGEPAHGTQTLPIEVLP